jgi:hypothetical protein
MVEGGGDLKRQCYTKCGKTRKWQQFTTSFHLLAQGNFILEFKALKPLLTFLSDYFQDKGGAIGLIGQNRILLNLSTNKYMWKEIKDDILKNVNIYL